VRADSLSLTWRPLTLERASLAAFDDDVMVGYLKIRYNPSAEKVHLVYLDGGVHPDYRRRGVGSVLADAGIAAADAVHAPREPFGAQGPQPREKTARQPTGWPAMVTFVSRRSVTFRAVLVPDMPATVTSVSATVPTGSAV
jgi:GNAT superfamily N-acetyltransferase